MPLEVLLYGLLAAVFFMLPLMVFNYLMVSIYFIYFNFYPTLSKTETPLSAAYNNGKQYKTIS